MLNWGLEGAQGDENREWIEEMLFCRLSGVEVGTSRVGFDMTEWELIKLFEVVMDVCEEGGGLTRGGWSKGFCRKGLRKVSEK